MTVQSSGEAGSRAASRWRLPGRVRSIPWSQDARAVKDLRLGAGVIGTFLPIMLIVWNWIAGDKTIVPTSMSGSYYTSSRNLFVGSLCALGVFLILYRHHPPEPVYLVRRCVRIAGGIRSDDVGAACDRGPWVNYLHHAAAGALE
jgi:hypothetical protein